MTHIGVYTSRIHVYGIRMVQPWQQQQQQPLAWKRRMEARKAAHRVGRDCSSAEFMQPAAVGWAHEAAGNILDHAKGLLQPQVYGSGLPNPPLEHN